jgi:hypothetical protein
MPQELLSIRRSAPLNTPNTLMGYLGVAAKVNSTEIGTARRNVEAYK